MITERRRTERKRKTDRSRYPQPPWILREYAGAPMWLALIVVSAAASVAVLFLLTR